MAEHGSPALNTQIESGNFDEKRAPAAEQPPAARPKVEDDDDEDEDIDALIEDLESQDGHGEEDEEEERDQHGGRVIPEELLQTVSFHLIPKLVAYVRARFLATFPTDHDHPCRIPAPVLLMPRSFPVARSTVSTR